MGRDPLMPMARSLPAGSMSEVGGHGSSAVFEAPAVVAGLDDVAVMSEAIEERGGLLASPKTLGHSPKARFVITVMEVCLQSLLIRWNRSCPPDWAKGNWPSSSTITKSLREASGRGGSDHPSRKASPSRRDERTARLTGRWWYGGATQLPILASARNSPGWGAAGWMLALACSLVPLIARPGVDSDFSGLKARALDAPVERASTTYIWTMLLQLTKVAEIDANTASVRHCRFDSSSEMPPDTHCIELSYPDLALHCTSMPATALA